MIFFQGTTNNIETALTGIKSIPSNGEALFVIGGQSNASKQATNSNITTADKRAYPNSLQWKSNAWEVYNPANESAHNQGFRLSQMAEANGVDIKIINVGVAASQMNPHLEGGSWYNTAYNYLKATTDEIISRGKAPYVIWVFVQGEADSNTLELANLYYGKQVAWAASWKADIPSATLIVSGIYVRSAHNPAWDIIVNEAKEDVFAENKVEGYYPVEGISDKDGLHRSYQGYQEEGEIIWDIVDALVLHPMLVPLT